MKLTSVRARILIAGLACVFAPLSQAAELLRIGDKAPEIKASRWVKGTPVQRFEQGHVYVVEFWATWCGPCKAAMPHLTELAAKYAGKVTVIGVNIKERPGQDVDRKVDDFVRDMGDKMGYTVCRELDTFMDRNWMEAGAQPGIPTSFVVDQGGKIAWIGGPAHLDNVLAQVVAGAYNDPEYAANNAKKQDRDIVSMTKFRTQVNALKGVHAAVEARNWKGAMAGIDELTARYPDDRLFLAQLIQPRITTLIHTDPRKVSDMMTTEKEPWTRTWAATAVAGASGMAIEAYEQAVKILDETNTGSGTADTYVAAASGYFHTGNKEKAAENARKAMDWLKARNSPAETVKSYEERLKQYY